MSKKVLVVLAEGFEEVEALTPVDFLLRAGAEVTLAGLGAKTVSGSHKISVNCNCTLEETPASGWDAIVLPGGMPGSANLAESSAVSERILNTFNAGKLVCAICAAPAVVLAPLGILKDRKAVCYPGMDEHAPEVRFYSSKVLTDGNVITARGAGCAAEFAFEIISALFGREKADSVAFKVVY